MSIRATGDKRAPKSRWTALDTSSGSPSRPNELYDLVTDPAELTNLIDIDQREHRTRQQKPARQLHSHFVRIAAPRGTSGTAASQYRA
jgi:hypothetical protein